MNERTVKEEAKLILYGMMNFVAIRENIIYYVMCVPLGLQNHKEQCNIII